MNNTILTNIKAKIEIKNNDSNEILLGMIKGISSLISNEIGRDGLGAEGLVPASRVEYFDRMPILLTHTPVTELAKVEIRSGTEYIEKTGVLFSEKTGKVDLRFREGMNKIRITYTGGINIAEPEYLDLRELIERLVIRQWKKIDNEGKSSTNLKDSTISWHNLLTPEDNMILDNYRHIWL